MKDASNKDVIVHRGIALTTSTSAADLTTKSDPYSAD